MAVAALFKKSPDQLASDTSLGADETRPILKMAERHDWTLFRTGLQQKAGVRAGLLRRLVLKELADNALDVGALVEAGLVQNLADDSTVYFIADDGPGLDGAPL